MNIDQPHSPHHRHDQQSELKMDPWEYLVPIAVASIFIMSIGIIILLISWLFGISPAALLNLP